MHSQDLPNTSCSQTALSPMQLSLGHVPPLSGSRAGSLLGKPSPHPLALCRSTHSLAYVAVSHIHCFFCSINCRLLLKSRTCLIPSQRPVQTLHGFLREGVMLVGWPGFSEVAGGEGVRAEPGQCSERVFCGLGDLPIRGWRSPTQRRTRCRPARGSTRRQSSSERGRRLSSRVR